MRILVMGHLGAGKTTLINRMLREVFNMADTKSTNGIVTTRKGGIRVRDGKWIHQWMENGMLVLILSEQVFEYYIIILTCCFEPGMNYISDEFVYKNHDIDITKVNVGINTNVVLSNKTNMKALE